VALSAIASGCPRFPARHGTPGAHSRQAAQSAGGRRHATPEEEVAYAALFAATPSPSLVLNPDLQIVAVNQAYCQVTGRTREDLLGQFLFDAFPDNPADPEADGVRNMSASLERVLSTREPDTVAVQRYDIPVPSRARHGHRFLYAGGGLVGSGECPSRAERVFAASLTTAPKKD
jgi:PAS domain S-box-containing protein